MTRAEAIRPEPVERAAPEEATAPAPTASEHPDARGGNYARPGLLEWSSHPVRHQHEKTALLVGVVALTAVAIYLNTGSVFWTVLSVALLGLGVYDYLLPTTYRIDGRGVWSRTLFFTRFKAWREIRSLHADPRGVLASPFPVRSRLDTFRGLYLRFDGNRERVMAALRARTSPPSPSGSSEAEHPKVELPKVEL